MFKQIRKKVLVLIFSLTLLIVTAGITVAFVIPSADELLLQSMATVETISSGHAIIDASVETAEDAFSGKVEVWAQKNVGPNGEPAFRIEILDATELDLIGLTAVTNGTEFWLYDPFKNEVIVGTADEFATIVRERVSKHEAGDWGASDLEKALPDHSDWDADDMPQTAEEMVAKLLEYVTAERSWTNQFSSDDAFEMRLIPIPEKMADEIRLAGGYLTLWLRESDQLPLGIEYSQGSLGYGKISATDAEINGKMSMELFTFQIPKGVELIQATDLLAKWEEEKEEETAVPLPSLTISELPNNVTVEPTQMVGEVVVQRFKIEDRSFVFAYGEKTPANVPTEATYSDEVTVRGVKGMIHTNETGDRTLLSWQEAGLIFVIGGDITVDDALKMAESVN